MRASRDGINTHARKVLFSQYASGFGREAVDAKTFQAAFEPSAGWCRSYAQTTGFAKTLTVAALEGVPQKPRFSQEQGMHDPDEYRTLPKVNYKSLEYRLYYTMSACYGWLDKNHPRQAELMKSINELIREYEASVTSAHRQRN
jgi:hypothetical protein